jgi:hypothetical protein
VFASRSRTIGLLALIIAAVVVVRVSLSNGLARHNPAAALVFDGHNAIAAAERAAGLVRAGKTESERQEIVRLSQVALARDLTQVKAASALGLVRDIDGRPQQAARLMDFAQRISRRDLTAQLWLIEDAVRDGDVRRAVAHYDIALRISKRSPAILFPVLVGAVGEPQVAAALADRMRAEPNWAGPFLYELGRQNVAPRAVVGLYQELARRHAHYDVRNAELFIQRAVSAGDITPAWQVYRLIEPAAAGAIVRNGDFARPSRPVPFDWEMTSDGDVTATRDQRDGQPVMRLEGMTGTGGLAARQLILAPPGTHRFDAMVYDLNQPPTSRPFVRLKCVGSGLDAATIEFPDGAPGGTALHAAFSVPAERCTAQWLELWLRPSYETSGVSAAIDNISIR